MGGAGLCLVGGWLGGVGLCLVGGWVGGALFLVTRAEAGLGSLAVGLLEPALSLSSSNFCCFSRRASHYTHTQHMTHDIQ